MKSVMQHPIVFLDSYIESDLCDFIVEQGKKLNIEEGAVYSKESEKLEDNKVRKAQTAFFEKGHWIESIVSSVLHAVNQTTWNARLANSEQVQFGIYGQGEFYGKHGNTVDSGHTFTDIIVESIIMNELAKGPLALIDFARDFIEITHG